MNLANPYFLQSGKTGWFYFLMRTGMQPSLKLGAPKWRGLSGEQHWVGGRSNPDVGQGSPQQEHIMAGRHALARGDGGKVTYFSRLLEGCLSRNGCVPERSAW